MATYLLDSNIVSEPSKPMPSRKVLEKLAANRSLSVISAVSYFEMLYGVLALPDGKRKDRLGAYLTETVVPFYDFVPYDFDCAKMNAKVIAKLESAGKPIPVIDSQIASIALAKGLVLVTRNVKDFAPVREFFPLEIENWFE